MTVGEWMDMLSSLDRGRNIWLVYDGVYVSEPEISVYEEDGHPGGSVEKGDYVINAW